MAVTNALNNGAIGIIGGIGPQASAWLHTQLVRKAATANTELGLEFPQIVHFSVRVPPFIREGSDQQRAIRLVSHAARSLVNSGATTIGLACNTAHILLPEVEARTGITVERIPEQVRRVVQDEGLERVGLLATQETIDRGLYGTVSDVAELIIPTPELTAIVEKHIVGVYTGAHSASDSAAFRELVCQFRDHYQLDSVIFGCTELPVAYGEGERTGIVDTLDVLADHLLAEFHLAVASTGTGEFAVAITGTGE
ncbi:aspartate/glutamate racemase family protein [Rhodococcus sp. NPDC060176]|uniref:aspartate/glutamate racemase family protein n=1 Tax=Rhodococcus sp. NPDC060176 TaxID=3347062 RepID=UPI003647F66A